MSFTPDLGVVPRSMIQNLYTCVHTFGVPTRFNQESKPASGCVVHQSSAGCSSHPPTHLRQSMFHDRRHIIDLLAGENPPNESVEEEDIEEDNNDAQETSGSSYGVANYA